MLIAQVCHFENDGDAHYRLHEPSRFLARLPGVTTIDCHFSHRYLPRLARLADVLVLQFVNDWELIALCAERRALGKITVFEANDDFFDLQPWSPIAARWRDRTVQELYSQLLISADGVQTSTDALAHRWRERGAKNVAVFKNHLSEIGPLPPVVDRPLTIGWAGSPGHFADWYHVVPHLTRWLAAHPEVHLAVMTNELAHSFFSLPASRYRFTKFGSLAMYFEFLRSIDIGLAPLLPTDYNRGRSDVKFLEYASQGVVGIFADLEPYRESVVPGETGLLFRTPDEMIQRLEQLRANDGLRQKLRTNAYNYARDRRMLADHIGERLRWYQSLLSTPVACEPIPDDIARSAHAAGRYLRLYPQEPERLLAEALGQSEARLAIERIEPLARKSPDFLVARQNLGRLLNDLQSPAAVGELTALCEVAPNRAPAWTELGRALFLQKDYERSRAALENAIGIAPNFLPAWQYLLRMLARLRHPTAATRAEEAVRRFPSCYPIALIAASALSRENAIELVSQSLERLASKFTEDEKPLAMAAFVAAILSLQTAAPTSRDLALLRRACEVFPESAKLANALGAALIATGDVEEGYREQIRAQKLRRAAELVQSETSPNDAPLYTAMFAEHIVRHRHVEATASRAIAPAAAPTPSAVPTPPVAAPPPADPWRDEAYRRYQAGDPAGATALCHDILRLNPSNAESTYLLGAIALDAGDIDRARDFFQQTTRLAPDNAVFANALGEILLQQDQQAQAEAQFRRTLELRPDYERAHNNLGRLMNMRGDLPQAQFHFEAAVRINPNYAIAHNNLGAVLQRQSKLDAAAERFLAALAIRKEYPEAHFNLGTVRQALGDPIGAMARFAEAVRLRPTYARSHFHLGQVLELQRRGPEALVCYETATRLQPDDAEMQRRLGDLLMQKPDWRGALAALERAVALQPSEPEPFARLLYARQLVCDWRTYEADIDRLWANAEKQIAAGEATSVVPFQAITLPWSRDRLLAVARSHCRAIAKHQKDVRRSPLPAASRRTPIVEHQSQNPTPRRFRIGYLSGDFYDHPISHLLYGMFGHHDRVRFEIFAYSFGPPDNSVYRRRVEAECEHFVEVAALSVGDLAARIAADGIDILIDLMGHTGINRLAVFAMRPAPIQVSFLGMLGTMGADFIDYVIGDRIMTPSEFATDFTEKIVTMPHSYLIAEPETAPPTGPVRRVEYGLPETGFVFCSFNSTYKLEPRTFAAWMRILSRTPGSVLWLYTTGEVLEGNLRREAEAAGVDPKRLVFAPFLPRPEHLARHGAADLFLDTRCYNAAATASLALQTGLPVLACLGDTFASRVGASLLHSVGLPEMIVGDLNEYVNVAVELASNPVRLRELRDRLRSNLPTAPLFDTRRFVINLERGFQLMADRHAAGEFPAHLSIEERSR